MGPRGEAASARIPSLSWGERSDWIDVKRALSPPAVGDGRADDTEALRKALAGLRDGATFYFPPGVYRIAAPLLVRNPSGARWVGGALVGSGRDTRIVWDGHSGGAMFEIDGVAYARFIGLELDGGGKAGVGFHYRAKQGFQTEVTHRHLAFRGFANAAILEDHDDGGQALAETTFEHCLFEDCERGAAFLRFNDYDYTFDGCEFRRCGVAIHCDHGNFYVRDCHFEDSRAVDIRDGSEHASSIRRCTSLGSRAFLHRTSSIAPITVQDCHVEAWKNEDGAIRLSQPAAAVFDCVFARPPRDEQGVGRPPIHTAVKDQRLLLSGNRSEETAGLTQGPAPMVLLIPPGQRSAALRSASQSFLADRTRAAGRVFDARRDFGAAGNGVADDAAAIQKTIDAAAAAGDAVAYLPTGRYVVRSTLRISGRNFSVEGSGGCAQLIWKGPEGGNLIEVRDPRNVALADLMVGAHDAGAMNNGIDILQLGSDRPSRMTYDGVYVFGMYQKAPRRKGLVLMGLGSNDVVTMPHVQGNLRFVDCGGATVLANCSYEGSVTVEGRGKAREGLLGFQTRLATIVSHGLYLRDNQNIVMSDFYVEQADNGFLLEGAPDGPPGRATIGGAKFHSFASSDPAKNSLLEIRGYQGQVALGPYQYYQEPKRMRLAHQGSGSVDILVWAGGWYGAKPAPLLGPAARLLPVGNTLHGAAPDVDPALERAFFQDRPTDSTLAKLTAALDDLRRLGEADLRLNHPEIPLNSNL